MQYFYTRAGYSDNTNIIDCLLGPYLKIRPSVKMFLFFLYKNLLVHNTVKIYNHMTKNLHTFNMRHPTQTQSSNPPRHNDNEGF